MYNCRIIVYASASKGLLLGSIKHRPLRARHVSSAVFIAPFFIAAVIYAVLVWTASRAFGVTGLMGVYLLAIVAFSYYMYRYVCGQPLTCDVGGPGRASHYIRHIMPLFAALGALGFGAVSVVVHYRSRKAAGVFAGIREVAVGSVIGFSGLVLGTLLLEVLAVWGASK